MVSKELIKENMSQINKPEIVRFISKDLSGGAGINYLEYPHSPLTADNPDILASVNNRLYGIFIPSSSEYAKPQHLLRRIFNSRLVYPQDLRTVLLFEESSNIYRNILSLSTHCVEVLNGQSIAHLIESLNSRLSRKDLLSKSVRFHTINRIFKYQQLSHELSDFNTGYGFFEIMQDQAKEGGLIPPHDWYADRLASPLQNSYACKDSNVYFKSKNKAGIKATIDNILTYSFFRRFQFDEHSLHYDNNHDKYSDYLNCDFIDILENRAMANTMFGLGIMPVSLSTSTAFNALWDITETRMKHYGK